MIKKIDIKGLKSIDEINLELKNINLLVGTNSSGKSTIIQSLLLASQNITNDKSKLNGNLFHLGEFREVRNFITNAKSIYVEIEDSKDKYEFEFFEEEEFDRSSNSKCSDIEFDKGLYYLSASRIGYNDTYEKNISSVYKFGIEGEYCLSYLEKNKDTLLDSDIVKDHRSSTLLYNLNFWFNYIIGANVEVDDIKQTDRIRAQFIGGTNRKVRTKNMGSGLSYLISILIMSLAMNKNDTLIIENPEIHLHPKAQSRLVDFFVFISKSNRQLIIETHSDHIFNGIRAAISNDEINANNVSINFLSLDERFCTINKVIKIGKRGRILNASKDLFDQFNIDLERMLGI